MEYVRDAWERAMRLQEVMLKAIGGELHWFRAAEILGMSPRSLRRWRERYERAGYDGLLDRRYGKPSVRRVSFAALEQVLQLYRDRYRGFNVRHFHEIVRRIHGVTLSYSYVKRALQTAGLVKKRPPRGRHRQRREPRACFGELLHLDGSMHPWLALRPEQRSCLIAVPDDATNRVLHAALYPGESTHAVMSTLRTVFETYGLPMALYTDRAKWAFYTPTAKGPVDKSRLTQVGRALERLGIEHIPAYSPQARGRSERLNRTFQDRLVNELRVAGVTSLTAANAYLVETFLPRHMRRLRGHRAIPPARSSRSARSISTPSCAMRRRVSSDEITPCGCASRSCRSRRSRAGAVALAWRSSSASILMAAIR